MGGYSCTLNKQLWEELMAHFHFTAYSRSSYDVDCIEDTTSSSSSIVSRLFIAVGMCLLSLFLATAITFGFQALGEYTDTQQGERISPLFVFQI